jgi:hypothetical protein
VSSSAPPEFFTLRPPDETRNDTHDAQDPEQPYQTSLQLRQVGRALAIGAATGLTRHSSRLQNSIGPNTIIRVHPALREVPRTVCAGFQTSSAHALSTPPSSSSALSDLPTTLSRPIALAHAPSPRTPSYSTLTLPFAFPGAQPPLSDLSSRRESASRIRSRPTWWKRTRS